MFSKRYSKGPLKVSIVSVLTVPNLLRNLVLPLYNFQNISLPVFFKHKTQHYSHYDSTLFTFPLQQTLQLQLNHCARKDSFDCHRLMQSTSICCITATHTTPAYQMPCSKVNIAALRVLEVRVVNHLQRRGWWCYFTCRPADLSPRRTLLLLHQQHGECIFDGFKTTPQQWCGRHLSTDDSAFDPVAPGLSEDDIAKLKTHRSGKS